MKYLAIIFLLVFSSVSCQEQDCLEFEDGVIAYQTFGQGFPVLIINGGPGMNSKGFESLAKLLSENNKVIIYDQRGTGKSVLNEMSASNMTIELMVGDIERLREHLGYKSWIILGQSFGGMLAYAYAAKHPDRVQAMVQSHSGGMSLRNVASFNVRNGLTSSENDSLDHYSLLIQRNPENEEFQKKRALFMAKAYVVGSEHEETISERLLQVNREINSMLWEDMRLNIFDKTEEMKEFEKNLLIMHGLQDVVPVDIAENSHNILPNSKLVTMGNCGHYGWLDRPEVYLKEVKAFLRTNSEQIN
ncbi:alpha/beta fold hydrolase [Christiangramia echinicola]|uniref:alpha/beta fold hydrolase n=1 Tax=Christiangramia echinicola TaxID=279359 RepID=UPI00042890E6|nr:alpha/beta fold hydrolase [Christiangramia echinicola]